MGTTAWIVAIVCVCALIDDSFGGVPLGQQKLKKRDSPEPLDVSPDQRCDELKTFLDYVPHLTILKTSNESEFREDCTNTLYGVDQLKDKGVLDACAASNSTFLDAYEQLVRTCSHGITAREVVLARVKRQAETTTEASLGTRFFPAIVLAVGCALIAMTSFKGV